MEQHTHTHHFTTPNKYSSWDVLTSRTSVSDLGRTWRPSSQPKVTLAVFASPEYTTHHDQAIWSPLGCLGPMSECASHTHSGGWIGKEAQVEVDLWHFRKKIPECQTPMAWLSDAWVQTLCIQTPFTSQSLFPVERTHPARGVSNVLPAAWDSDPRVVLDRRKPACLYTISFK